MKNFHEKMDNEITYNPSYCISLDGWFIINILDSEFKCVLFFKLKVMNCEFLKSRS